MVWADDRKNECVLRRFKQKSSLAVLTGKENVVPLRSVKTLCPLDDQEGKELAAPKEMDMNARYEAEVKKAKRRRFKFGFMSTDNKTLVRGGGG